MSALPVACRAVGDCFLGISTNLAITSVRVLVSILSLSLVGWGGVLRLLISPRGEGIATQSVLVFLCACVYVRARVFFVVPFFTS